MDAHRDVVCAAAYDELDVDAVGIDRVVVARLLEQLAGLVERVDEGTACGLPIETWSASWATPSTLTFVVVEDLG